MFDHSGQQIEITDHCLMVANVRERLTVNKQIPHRFHTERLNLMKINEVEGKGNITLRSQTGLQLSKICTIRWKLILLGK
jgi:hypothetical protein